MKPERVCRPLVLIVLAALSPDSMAQDKAPVSPPASSMSTASPAVPSAVLINDWLRDRSPVFNQFDLGGQFRVRYEVKEQFAIVGIPNSVDFRTGGTTTDNEYWLFREKVHLGYTPCDWFTAYVEGRDSEAQGDLRNPNPETDVFDLHQAYVTLGNLNDFPLTAKIGRQEIVYGDERLIGASDWNNVLRVFDAAKLHYEIENLWVDLFGGRVVLPDDHHFNEPNNYDWFSGIYASTRLIPKQTTEMYFLSRNVSAGSTRQITTTTPNGGPTPRDIYTIGLRFKSLPGQFGGWDYDGEFAGQFGNFAMTVNSPRLSQEAFAAHVAGGYTWTNAFGTPRLGLEYNYSSGDSSTNDNKHQTFDNLFPTNHKFYGFMDFFCWQNMHDLRVAASIKPLSKLTVTLDYHSFWLADTHDFFYQLSGSPRRTGGYGINPDAGSYVGSEVDLVGTYAITQYASVQAGYGHFFIGEYVKNSLSAVGSSDADWVYVQLQVNF